MLQLFSPAKINLFLRVIGRREDGYHELSTLMQAIDLGDILTLSKAQTDSFSCTDHHIPCDPRNLVYQALILFRQKTGINTAVRIHLNKKIPMQAGLGGGSSNAATTLWGLNSLFNTQIEISTLQKWGSALGADVPFFFSTGIAHCSGIGEDVAPASTSFSSFDLHKPYFGLCTKKVFQELVLPPNNSNDILFKNDLEAAAFKLCPALATFKKNLSSHYKYVFMTGSGSTFVGIDGICLNAIRTNAIYRSGMSWYKK